MKSQQQTISAKDMLHRSKTCILKNNDSRKDSIYPNQSKKKHPILMHLSRVLSSIFGALFLATLIVPSILLYDLTPKASADSSLISNSSTYKNRCGGISSRSTWKINDTYVITMNINTTQCHFTSTPLYFISIGGTSSHFCLIGQNAIYLPTNPSFQIYTKSICGSSASSLVVIALTNGWDVSWTGFSR